MLHTITKRLEICIDNNIKISEVDHYTWIFSSGIFRLPLEITLLLQMSYELLSQSGKNSFKHEQTFNIKLSFKIFPLHVFVIKLQVSIFLASIKIQFSRKLSTYNTTKASQGTDLFVKIQQNLFVFNLMTLKYVKYVIHNFHLLLASRQLKAHRDICKIRCFEKYCSCDKACQFSVLLGTP